MKQSTFVLLLRFALSALMLMFIQKVQGQNSAQKIDSTYRFSYQTLRDSTPISKTICNYDGYENNDRDCYNFSSCISYNWDLGSRTWIPTIKIDERKERGGQYHSRITYTWNDSSQIWQASFRSLDIQEENLQKYLESEWSQTKHDWVHRSIRETAYDAEGRIVLSADRHYLFDQDRWDGNQEERAYYRSGRLAETIQSVWDDEIQDWEPVSKEERTYQSGIAKLKFRWRYDWGGTLNGWLLKQTDEHYFDADGNETRIEICFEDPVTFAREESEYDSEGRLISWQRMEKYDPIIGWVGQRRHEYTYHDSGAVLYFDEFLWNTETSDWQEYRRSETYWAFFGNLAQLFNYNWNAQTEQWEISQSFEAIYDSLDRVVSQIRFSYNPSGEPRGNKEDYVLNDNGQTIQRFDSEWDVSQGIWVLDRRTDNHFTLDGRIYAFSSYRFDQQSQSWLGSVQVVFTFDEHGNTTFNKRLRWDIIGNEWFPSSGVATYWSDCEVEKTISFQTDPIDIYPNPVTSSWVFVDIHSTLEVSYEVISVGGKRIANGTLEPLHDRIYLGNANNGLYIIRFFVGDGVSTKKVMVRR